MKIFKNRILRGIVAFAFCLLATASCFNGVTFAKAEGHVHSFTDGVCSCGSIKIEAEDGVIQGTSHYSNVAPDMIEVKAEASGGKEIGCFDVNGNTAEWTFSLTSAVENVNISFALKSFIATDDMSGFKLTVNGNDLEFAEGSRLHETYNNATPYEIVETADFSTDGKELVVKLEILNASKACTNIDYLILNLQKGTLQDVVEDPRDDPYAVKIEAENGTIVGTSHYPSVAPDMIENKDGASGGKEIGCFDVTGNYVEWTFDFEKAADNVRVFFYVRSLVDKPTDGFGIYVDGNKVEWTSKNFAKTDELAVPYRMYYSESFSVTAGNHVVKLEVLDASNDKCAVNFDYVMLAGYGEINVTPVIEDLTPPTISAFFDNLYVGSVAKVLFSVSDNVSLAENIIVTVKVFYDYGGTAQEEITLTDGEFTPTKQGEYTAIITAVDEKGNSSEKTFTEEAVINPNNDSYAVKIEAEDGNIVGTSQFPSITEDMIEFTNDASGEKEIGCFAVDGNYAEWSFDFSENCDNVVIYFYAKSLINGTTDGFGIYVDGTKIDWNSEYFEKTSDLSNKYKFYSSKSFSVTEGRHVVRLEVLDASNDKCAVNFDYVMLAGYGKDVASPVLPDKEAPVIGEISVGTPELNKETTISVEITDNESSRENLNVLVRVWLDYKGDNEEELTVTDGKFTPTKNGLYTVLVRAVDENGNMSDKTYSFRIGAEPVDGEYEWIVSGSKELPSWAIGLIIAGAALLVAGGLTAYELFVRKNGAK